MPSNPEAPPDDERLYALIQQEAWMGALDWLHRAWRRLEGDARARRAAEVFDEAFFADLQARPPEALQRRLMLHHGRMRALPDAPLARLADALARRKAEEGDDRAVQSLGRLGAEENEASSTSGAQRELVPLGEVPVQLTRVSPSEGVPDGRASLFKSPQERAFFEALRAVFPTHLVYPNAALSAVLDFERLQQKLTQAERDYFFRALVDAVVADPLDGLRPVHFFELDSTHHDTAERRRNDQLKDRILAKAGQTLFRLRQEGRASREAFSKALRATMKVG